MKNAVVCFVRDYNDLDCRIPLLLEFSRDKKYNRVEVVGIPLNSGINDPRRHELSSYLLENNIAVRTIYDFNTAPLLKAVYMVYRAIERISCSELLVPVCNRLKRQVFKIIFALSNRDKKWVRGIIRDFKQFLIIIDEIVFHQERSFFVDELIKEKSRGGYTIYSFLAGQDTYLNLWHDRKLEPLFRSEKRVGICCFVPSRNDKDVLQKKMPQETIEVVGNTRFDLPWVKTLFEMTRKSAKGSGFLPGRTSKNKIVFMLSKIEYGGDLAKIKETIDYCAALDDSCLIVKPHTRGMSLNMFKGLGGNVYSGRRYSSNDLIRWADAVLFTGSSIVFQAMQLGKKVIFLKYCQKYKTIFDECEALLVAADIEDVGRFINSNGKYQVDCSQTYKFLLEHVYNGIRSGEVCRDIKEKLEFRRKRIFCYA